MSGGSKKWLVEIKFWDDFDFQLDINFSNLGWTSRLCFGVLTLCSARG